MLSSLLAPKCHIPFFHLDFNLRSRLLKRLKETTAIDLILIVSKLTNFGKSALVEGIQSEVE